MVQEDGAGQAYMHLVDQMTPKGRRRLCNSPYNLCAACLFQSYMDTSDKRKPRSTIEIEAIARMEFVIKQSEGTNVI
jgi:hypothetical protein